MRGPIRLAFSGWFDICPFDSGRLEVSGVFAGPCKPGLERRNPCRQALHLRPQRPNQGVLVGVAQVAEVRKLGHTLV